MRRFSTEIRDFRKTREDSYIYLGKTVCIHWLITSSGSSLEKQWKKYLKYELTLSRNKRNIRDWKYFIE